MRQTSAQIEGFLLKIALLFWLQALAGFQD